MKGSVATRVPISTIVVYVARSVAPARSALRASAQCPVVEASSNATESAVIFRPIYGIAAPVATPATRVRSAPMGPVPSLVVGDFTCVVASVATRAPTATIAVHVSPNALKVRSVRPANAD